MHLKPTLNLAISLHPLYLHDVTLEWAIYVAPEHQAGSHIQPYIEQATYVASQC